MFKTRLFISSYEQVFRCICSSI